MEIEEEEEIVWERILPNENELSRCPILMCPDDNDFFCTLIIAEIENRGNVIQWTRLDIDQTRALEPDSVGSKVNWSEKMKPFVFA